MKNLRSVLSTSFALSLGALVVSCGSFSAGTSGGGGGATSPTPGTGGSAATGDPTGTGASGTGATGSGGSRSTGNTTGTGTGAAGAVGSGGSGATTGFGGTIGSGGSGVTTGAGGGSPPSGGTPCSILAAAGNTCVAAHSTVRVVYPGYTGPLYQLCRGSVGKGPNACTSKMTMDIGSVSGGYADAASQDAFCAGSTCTITIIYDQSPNKNDLQPSPPGQRTAGSALNPADAMGLKTTLNGHPAYGVLIKPATGYRAGCKGCGVPVAKGTAVGDEPETEYMVTSQKDLVDGCCFDYGNAETDSHADGAGSMEAVYFGEGVSWDSGAEGGHSAPWVMADLENGLFAGYVTTGAGSSKQTIPGNTALRFDFVTAVVVGDVGSQNGGKGRFALYGGDATSGVVKTMYDGIRPTYDSGYNPMHKQGSIILGTGGDTSDSDGGRWYEGVMASGAATLPTVNALQANIVAAGYGK
jgi:non-reducing end alpha-L-arabinofuranosidase